VVISSYLGISRQPQSTQRNNLSATSATLMASFCRGRFETCPYAGSGL